MNINSSFDPKPEKTMNTLTASIERIQQAYAKFRAARYLTSNPNTALRTGQAKSEAITQRLDLVLHELEDILHELRNP